MSSDEEVSSDEEWADDGWWPQLLSGEKASANLREVFVMTDRCDGFFMRSEAAIGSEL